MKRKIPLGIQDFLNIRQDGFIYVDTTARILGIMITRL